MRLIPVKLDCADVAAGKPNSGYALQIPPAASTVLPSDSHDLANSSPTAMISTLSIVLTISKCTR